MSRMNTYINYYFIIINQLLLLFCVPLSFVLKDNKCIIITVFFHALFLRTG